MFRISKYFLYFFLLSLLFTMIAGVIAALLPGEIAAVLTAIPYMAAMVSVLHLFLKQQRRAPTSVERLQFSLGYILIFVAYNLLGVLSGVYLFSRDNPQIWDDFQSYLHNTEFVLLVAGMMLVLTIPLFLITYWFYGKQAQRMANKMFGPS